MGDRRLTLRIATLQPPLEGNELILGVGEVQAIAAAVSAEGCKNCRVKFEADERYFELLAGSPPSVALGPGIISRTIEWKVRVRRSGSGLRIDIVAQADSMVQQLSLPVTVHRIED